jgi:hypothetical protein
LAGRLNELALAGGEVDRVAAQPADGRQRSALTVDEQSTAARGSEAGEVLASGVNERLGGFGGLSRAWAGGSWTAAGHPSGVSGHVIGASGETAPFCRCEGVAGFRPGGCFAAGSGIRSMKFVTPRGFPV